MGNFKSSFLMLALTLSSMAIQAQIVFHKGSFAEAQSLAQSEKKLIFIDFSAEWCGPCKQMEKLVFTDKTVGAYYNAHFVSMQIDVEKQENAELVKAFGVTAMPTLAILNADGSPISVVTGARDVKDFLKMGKVACGEEESYESLYEKYKKDKTDLGLQQDLLKEAPAFVGGLDGIEAQKWIARVDKLYYDYEAAKMGPDFINEDDYVIARKFHRVHKDDALLEFINTNIDAYRAKMGDAPAAWVIEYNNQVIEDLAKAGNDEYKKYLARIDGDMKTAYGIAPAGNISISQKMTYYYDGIYLLYYKKNVASYIDLMTKYIDAMGNQATSTDYGQIAQNMYYATKGKMESKEHRQAEKWLLKALSYNDIKIMDKINLLTMLGDCRKATSSYKQAGEAYNQAYMETFQLPAKMTAAQMQMIIKRKLESIDGMK